MTTLTCIIITKDEEESIARCIHSLPARREGDELLVVDTGSTDRTREIVALVGAATKREGDGSGITRIETYKPPAGPFDFSAARNYAEAFVRTDYVYWQDADEVLVAGADIIREIVDANKETCVRPLMIWQRDQAGEVVRDYARQDLLHKRGAVTWKRARHECTVINDGFTYDGRIEQRIAVEQIERTGGDRAYGDAIEALKLDARDERGLFYLAREHSYRGQHEDVIRTVNDLLRRPVEWPIQRSDAAILKGNALKALERHAGARAAYLQAVQEWGAWAEPYYALGCLHYELAQWPEAVAWFAATMMLEPPEGYFVDQSVYDWRRSDMMARSLAGIGRVDEARAFGAIALAKAPGEQHLADNMKFYAA